MAIFIWMALSLFNTPLDQAEIDFENEGGETYICGNPPYKGGTEQDDHQKADMEALFANVTDSWKSLDYVSGWFYKFARYANTTQASLMFVAISERSAPVPVMAAMRSG